MADSLVSSSAPTLDLPRPGVPPLQCVASGAFGRRVLEALRGEGLSLGLTVDLDVAAQGLDELAAADTLVILDVDRPEVMTRLWDRLAGTACRLHLIGLLDDALTVGPHFRADRPGCPECFARRRLAVSSQDDAGRLDKLSRTCLARLPEARPGFPPFLPALAAGVLAARLRRPLEESDGRFLRFLADGSFLEEGRLLALHGCRCRGTVPNGRRTTRHLAAMLGLPAAEDAAPGRESGEAPAW